MAEVLISFRGRAYQIACEDGQEVHITRLGQYLDQQAEQLLANTGPVSDNMLLMLVSLLVADKLSDAAGGLEGRSYGDTAGEWLEAEEAIVAATDTLTSRIESIAERLEGA